MKDSFQNVVKRIFAGFMASVVFAYSLLIAPCFGVGAVNFDLAEWFKAVGSTAITIGSSGSGVASLIGTLLMNVGVDMVQSKVSTSKPEGFEISQPLANINSFAGNAVIDSHDAVVTVYTRPAATFTYTDLWYDYSNSDLSRFRLCNAVWDGGSRSFYFSISPGDGDGNSNSWQDDDYVTISYIFKYPSEIDCEIRFYDSSGSSVHRPFDLTFYSIYSTGATYTKTFSNLSGYPMYPIRLQGYSSSVSYSDYLSLLDNYTSPFGLSICGTSIVSVGPNSDNFNYPESFGTYNYTNITNENYYDYLNNVSYPYTVNTYPEWTVLSPPPDYVIPDPTEEPTEATGTGAVIIIDPFTLPPEWVESDVVELNTEAYTIDYDTMIDEPLDEINYPLTPTNPLLGGANILSFGIQFLKDGGVFYIICTLLVIGLLIRFLGI